MSGTVDGHQQTEVKGLEGAARPEAPARVGPEGRYEIVRILGRGAMGVVYLARDRQIGRDVALKTFSYEHAVESEEDRARFLREGQTAGRLTHPNIVTVHDVFEEGGAPYIAMEYVEGHDLLTLLRSKRRIDPDLATLIAREIADALDYAHSRGVIHRDVKPANIILTAGDHHPRITDFGIARVHHSSLTIDGQVLGTPNYMAPEQIEGKPADQRADLFSLGVVLFEILTGERPFPGDNLMAVAKRIVEQPAPLASAMVDDVSPQLAMIIDKLLAKQPERRYGRGSEVSHDLRLAAVGAPAEQLIAAQDADATLRLKDALARPPRLESLRRGTGRALRTAWQTAASASLLLLLAGVGYLTWSDDSQVPPPPDTGQERLRESLPHVKEGLEHFEASRFEEARLAFERALALSPGHAGIERLRDRSAEGLSGVAPPPPPPEKRQAALDIALYSELPTGRISVLHGDEVLWRREFAFEPEKSRFRLPWSRPRPGRLTATRFVAEGRTELRVVFSRPGEEPSQAMVSAELRADDQALLDIRIDRNGELEATLSFW